MTSNSATCDKHTYWGILLGGSSDQITFFRMSYPIPLSFQANNGIAENYVHDTSGRSPALSGNTLFHAVNNVWASNSGHLLEGSSNGMGVYEGNYFIDCPTVVASGFVGSLYSSEAAYLSQCAQYLGRNCVANVLSNSGSFSYDDTNMLSLFQGKSNIVAAASASSIQSSVMKNAGNTLNL